MKEWLVSYYNKILNHICVVRKGLVSIAVKITKIKSNLTRVKPAFTNGQETWLYLTTDEIKFIVIKTNETIF